MDSTFEASAPCLLHNILVPPLDFPHPVYSEILLSGPTRWLFKIFHRITGLISMEKRKFFIELWELKERT